MHYYFVVTAYASDGAESDYSNQAEATLAAKVTPTVAPGPADGSLQLTWAAPPAEDNIAGVYVYYGKDADHLSQASTALGPTATGAELTGLDPGAQYFIAVETFCADGGAKRSDVLGATSPGTPGSAGGNPQVREGDLVGGCALRALPASGCAIALALSFSGWPSSHSGAATDQLRTVVSCAHDAWGGRAGGRLGAQRRMPSVRAVPGH